LQHEQSLQPDWQSPQFGHSQSGQSWQQAAVQVPCEPVAGPVDAQAAALPMPTSIVEANANWNNLVIMRKLSFWLK
jgi:hypothetical protein